MYYNFYVLRLKIIKKQLLIKNKRHIQKVISRSTILNKKILFKLKLIHKIQNMLKK